MKAELFPFQKRALSELRMKSAEAVYRYGRSHSKQVVSFTALQVREKLSLWRP